MNSIHTRVNGQAGYRQPAQANAAWREEMLGQLLNQMRDRKLPQETVNPASATPQLPGKGYYVDLYV